LHKVAPYKLWLYTNWNRIDEQLNDKKTWA